MDEPEIRIRLSLRYGSRVTGWLTEKEQWIDPTLTQQELYETLESAMRALRSSVIEMRHVRRFERERLERQERGEVEQDERPRQPWEGESEPWRPES